MKDRVHGVLPLIATGAFADREDVGSKIFYKTKVIGTRGIGAKIWRPFSLNNNRSQLSVVKYFVSSCHTQNFVKRSCLNNASQPSPHFLSNFFRASRPHHSPKILAIRL